MEKIMAAMNPSPDLSRIVRRSDCDCAKTCFLDRTQANVADDDKTANEQERARVDGTVVDISMGFTVEVHFGDLARRHPNTVAMNATCNRIAVLSWRADAGPVRPFERLVWLDLSHNMLTCIPPDLARACPSLVHLDLSSNHFSDLISVQNIGGLIKLTHVDFSYNQLHSITGIQHLTCVTHLALHRNRIESVTPLIGCLHLVRLNLAHNLLTSVAECLTAISRLSQLRHLDVYGNPFCVENGTSDFRDAFALKTRLVFLDGANIRTINSDLPPSFLTNPDPTVGNLLELRRTYEGRMRTIYTDHQMEIDRLKRLMEDLQQKFDDRCKRLALDYDAATKHSVHTLR